jgi:hypothetical protein
LTLLFAIPVVALVAEARGAEGLTPFCAKAAGAPEISNAAAEIKTNLRMVVSSLTLEPGIANPERRDVFPFDACEGNPEKKPLARSDGRDRRFLVRCLPLAGALSFAALQRFPVIPDHSVIRYDREAP